jgi:hypothetical protein
MTAFSASREITIEAERKKWRDAGKLELSVRKKFGRAKHDVYRIPERLYFRPQEDWPLIVRMPSARKAPSMADHSRPLHWETIGGVPVAIA